MAGWCGPSNTALAPSLGWSLESIAPRQSVSRRGEPPDPLDPEARARRPGAPATATKAPVPVDNPETLSHLAAHTEPGPSPGAERVGRRAEAGLQSGAYL